MHMVASRTGREGNPHARARACCVPPGETDFFVSIMLACRWALAGKALEWSSRQSISAQLLYQSMASPIYYILCTM